MTSLRKLGYNVQNIVLKKGLSDEFLAQKMNLSVKDIRRIYDARLILTPAQLYDLTNILGIKDPMTLFELPDDVKTYGYCVGHFKDLRNEEKILNIIDDYIDLVESLRHS